LNPVFNRVLSFPLRPAFRRPTPAVFLDRDGTLVKEKDYLSRPEQVRVFRRVPAALRLLRKSGYALVVISNQSGLGRGYFTQNDLKRVNARLLKDLRRRGARLDALYFCPHHPRRTCPCRKPKPAMIQRAARDLRLDLRRSYMVGDNAKDIHIGRRLNLGTVRVLTGYGKTLAKRAPAHHTGKDLYDAARWILRQPPHASA